MGLYSPPQGKGLKRHDTLDNFAPGLKQGYPVLTAGTMD